MKISRSGAIGFVLAMAMAVAASACGEDDMIDDGDAGLVQVDGSTRDAGVAGNADASSPSPDASSPSPDASTGGAAFGATCTNGPECESGVCGTFGMLGQRCTSNCTEDSQCPSGSMGMKCNMQGICRP